MLLTTRVHRAVPATALAALIATLGAGCGAQTQAGGPDDVPGPVTDPVTASRAPGPGVGTAAYPVVFFSAAPKLPADGHEILHDQGEVGRYAAAFAARDPQAQARIVAAGRSTDFTRQVLVGWTATTGCSAATAATLSVSGDRLGLQVSQPKPPPECVVAFRVSVVFRAARESLPAHPVFG